MVMATIHRSLKKWIKELPLWKTMFILNKRELKMLVNLSKAIYNQPIKDNNKLNNKETPCLLEEQDWMEEINSHITTKIYTSQDKILKSQPNPARVETGVLTTNLTTIVVNPIDKWIYWQCQQMVIRQSMPALNKMEIKISLRANLEFKLFKFRTKIRCKYIWITGCNWRQPKRPFIIIPYRQVLQMRPKCQRLE